MASVAELPKNAGNLQYKEQAIHARSGLNHQNVEEEFCWQTGDETMVISGRNRLELTTTLGFSTKLSGSF